jgi:hypothetical protein
MTEEEYNDENPNSEEDESINIDKIYIMYKIKPLNDELNFSYIGHTSMFNKRKNQHQKNTTNTKDHKHYHLKVYQTIRDNGGWDAWEMIEIEKFKCSTKLEARMREQQLMVEHNTTLNTCKSFITEEERKKKKQEITNKYKAEHVELIKEQQQQYKQDHKDVIKEQMRVYRQEHKAEIYEKKKAYVEANKEKTKEIKKAWAQANKEQRNEKRRLNYATKKAKLLEEQQQLKEIKN